MLVVLGLQLGLALALVPHQQRRLLLLVLGLLGLLAQVLLAQVVALALGLVLVQLDSSLACLASLCLLSH